MDPRLPRMLVIGGALVVVALAVVLVLLLRRPGVASLEGAPAAPAVAEPKAAEKKAATLEEARPSEAPEAGARAEAPPLIVERFGARRASCAGFCDLEATCGFRSFADCTAQSCEGDLRKLSASDFRVAEQATCAAAALAPCEEACWKRGECEGEHRGDQQCKASCWTLVEQLPVATYRENRCIIESPCDELPLCAERQGR